MEEERKEFDFLKTYTKWANENQKKCYEDTSVIASLDKLNKAQQELADNLIVATFENLYLYAYQQGYEDCKREMEGDKQ